VPTPFLSLVHLRHLRFTLATLGLAALSALSGCQRGFEQDYTADGAPVLDARYFLDLRREGAFFAEQRASTTVDGCRVTTVITDTPGQVFTTRYTDCPGSPKQTALVSMRHKSDGHERSVMDLTADREPLFEHSVRVAEVDGEAPPELIVLGCSGAQRPEDCSKTWVYRETPGQRYFANVFAASYDKLWIGAHYIVIEIGASASGLPRTPSDLRLPVPRESVLGAGHLSRQIYLRHPPRRPDALDLPGLHDENTVTWHHGLLVHVDFETATGQCILQYPSKPDGALRPLNPVPEVLTRFCAASLRP
jgi:hypothetical protein